MKYVKLICVLLCVIAATSANTLQDPSNRFFGLSVSNSRRSFLDVLASSVASAVMASSASLAAASTSTTASQKQTQSVVNIAVTCTVPVKGLSPCNVRNGRHFFQDSEDVKQNKILASPVQSLETTRKPSRDARATPNNVLLSSSFGRDAPFHYYMPVHPFVDEMLPFHQGQSDRLRSFFDPIVGSLGTTSTKLAAPTVTQMIVYAMSTVTVTPNCVYAGGLQCPS